MSMKSLAKGLLHRFGYEISRVDRVGINPFADMVKVLPDAALIFDVGANTGQSARRFREVFPRADIHSFEPSPSTFRELQQATASDSRIHAWNCALGAVPSRQLLYHYNGQSDLNSLLPAGPGLWAKPATQVEVEVGTIDSFRAERRLPAIDILKSDTQGYDLNVLHGARRSLRADIRLIYLELNFAQLYEGQSSFGEQFDLLTSLGFRLFSLYQMFRVDGMAGWTDALFMHRSVIPVHVCVADAPGAAYERTHMSA